MAISEIEKLERRYAENPQGLTFAPLAEVHRKNGDASRALELLGPGLALHPDYIPASIVLGRCHLDLGDQHAAEAAFMHVLRLDGENVIALKALAEITEHLLRLEESEQWLHTLLSIDRSNHEAREQLERVQASRRQAESGTSASPDAVLATELAGESPGEPEAEFVEAAPFGAEPAAPVAPPSLASADAFEPEAESVAAPDAPSGEEATLLAFGGDLQSDAPEVLSAPVEPLSGIIGMTESEGISHIEVGEDIVLRSSGASEFQVPNASDEWFASAYAEPAPPEPGVAPEPPPPAWREPEPPVDPMITESMAELLLSQGHRDEALRVYRELDERAGGGSRWRGKIAELEAAAPGPSPAPRPNFSAAATGGRSTGEFLRAMLASRPPSSAPGAAARGEGQRSGSGPDPAGAPTRPALDALSLSSVFGDEGNPTRPAVPSTGALGAVSFDEFFNAPASGGASRPDRPADSRSDDLDQFHAWLQNLKR